MIIILEGIAESTFLADTLFIYGYLVTQYLGYKCTVTIYVNTVYVNFKNN